MTRTGDDNSKKLVWVLVGKTDHAAFLLSSMVQPTVKIRWVTTGEIEEVPSSSVKLDIGTRKRKSRKQLQQKTISSASKTDSSSSVAGVISSRKKAAVVPPTPTTASGVSSGNDSGSQRQKAFNSLCSMPGIKPKEARDALKHVGAPYGLQSATQFIRNCKKRALFTPFVGMEIQKYFSGVKVNGKVLREEENLVFNEAGVKVKVWLVEYEDGDCEEMDADELFRCRRNKPVVPASCGGRQLGMLELFCGKAIVSQEFCELKWKCMSIDNANDSNATMQMDILDLDMKSLDFVPDFIWASPPCHTYSIMAGKHHRSVRDNELEKTKESRRHNFFFQKMAEIMRWCKNKHPHLIVVIENPVGMLQNMPLMKEFEYRFGLHSTTVDYCAFGRDEKKPTKIWTNNLNLKERLSEFTCKSKCPIGIEGGRHTVGVNQDRQFDFSVIPQPLAEVVAEYVNATFVINRIRSTRVVSPDE